jgi:hypothetical protein
LRKRRFAVRCIAWLGLSLRALENALEKHVCVMASFPFSVGHVSFSLELSALPIERELRLSNANIGILLE